MIPYVRQLLTSSGLAAPVRVAAAASAPATPVSAPDIAELSIESIGPAAPVAQHPAVVSAPAVPAPSALEDKPGRTQKVEAGIVEIGQPFLPPATPAPEVSVQAGVTRPVRRSDPVPPATKEIGKPAATADSTVSSEPPAASAPKTPTLPTREQLIEHVFRWVGQNPADATPAALKAFPPPPDTSTREPSSDVTGGNRAAAAPRAPQRTLAASSAQESVQAPPSSAPVATLVPVAAPSSPRRADAPVAQAAAPARPAATESTVEISIGTLQIQVEAPPGPAPAKPARRPASRRSAQALPAAPASARPAIDLNRLRRGFYL